MTLNLADVLRHAWRLWRADRALLIPLAGIFFLLPALAQALFLPPPVPASAASATLADQVRVIQQWYGDHFGALLSGQLWTMAGAAIALCFYLRAEAGTLGEAIALGLRQWPRFVLLTLAADLLLAAGFMAFIVPGYYLMGRLILAGPVLIAERRGVIHAIAASVRRTRGRGFLLAGLAAFAPVVGYLAAVPVQAIGAALDRAPLANPVSGAIIELALSAIVAAAVLAGVLIRVALYRHVALAR